MSKDKKLKFYAAVTCQDGRIHRATIKYIREHYGDHYVDMITETGPNKVLAQNAIISRKLKLSLIIKELWGIFRIRSIKERLIVSVKNHQAEMIFVVGHEHCAGNVCHRKSQEEHLREARKKIESFNFTDSGGKKIPIILLWVNEDWQTVEEVK